MGQVGTFECWIKALEARHLADLTFAEVTRALRALSTTYVEDRGRLGRGAALSGAGKRAAFAMFYGPLHYLLVRHITTRLPRAAAVQSPLIDLGCGTGASGAAWAASVSARIRVEALDRHPWAAAEARWTYRQFGMNARVRAADLQRSPLPRGSSVLASFCVNELDDRARDRLLQRFVAHHAGGGHVLVVEPIAGFVAPWWKAWQETFERAGGRADEWRVEANLPEIVARLDRSARLDHRTITGRSLWL